MEFASLLFAVNVANRSGFVGHRFRPTVGTIDRRKDLIIGPLP